MFAALMVVAVLGVVGWRYASRYDSANRASRTPVVDSRPSCPDGMVLIPSGDLHGRRVEPFCMDRTEVTTASYRACVNSGAVSGCAMQNTMEFPGILPVRRNAFDPECNLGRSDREGHPVNCVDWDQADMFCHWRGARLPTEIEWEYGAVGIDGRTYSWGNGAPSNQLCWSGVNRRESTCAVGSFPSGRSPFGLDDMLGNVWEWTSTVDKIHSVYRGGSWSSDDPSWVRATARDSRALEGRRSRVGFRCARAVR